MDTKTQELIGRRLMLYHSLFKGREDVYAYRWQAQDGRSGYSPARKGKDGAYIPMTERVVRAHLGGRTTVGIYPLLPDGTTWLLVVDFDGKQGDPLADAQRLVAYCKDWGIPAYLERSRSGAGYHVWIFFSTPVPAWKARLVALRVLLPESGVQMDEKAAFDRLFPNQDRHSGKGLGNLIALPLQGERLKHGCTAFLDTSNGLNPYPSQWTFLETILRTDEAELDGIMGEFGLTEKDAPQTSREAAPGPEEVRQRLAGGFAEGEGRNEAAFTTARRLAGLGMPQEEAQAYMEAWNASNQPPLSSEELQRTVESAYRREEEGALQGKPNSQADRLVKLCVMEVQLFHDQTQTPYARVRIGDHLETWPCRGRAFRRWLSRKMFETEEKAPSGEAIASALNVIEAKAVFDGERRELNNRVAFHDGAIWYDLTDERWRAIRVTPGGWQVIDTPPILFVRYDHQAPQVDPIRGGDVGRLFDFVPVSGDGPRLLLLVYLVSCFIPDIPHPVVHPHGPQGSGKTSLLRASRRLVDPSAVETQSFPRDGNELVQALSHHWACFFDNVSVLQDWHSDALCRAVTGEGFTKRVLYSVDDDFVYRFRRCVGLNGINVAATRPDLLDRSILVALERIPPKQRRPETALWTAFEKERPGILGGIFDALAEAMRLLPEVKLAVLPRMADFAQWGCAIAQALGYKAEDFLRAYGENIAEQNAEVLQGHPVAATVLALMKDRENWESAPAELLAKLVEIAESQKIDTRAKAWPKAAHILTRRLNEVRPNLQDVGILIERTHGKANVVTLRKIEGIGVSSVEASNSLPNSELHDDAVPTPLMPTKVASNTASPHNPSKNNNSDATDTADATFPTPEGDELMGGRV